ncbi:MAG: hypothetical protein VW715_14145 [Rhodospirillales bacterium]|jgi:hypothetical protein|tara:strand:- start:237 stop:623 length:387 start_codon:yes stop_codon:yes gene_type:complete
MSFSDTFETHVLNYVFTATSVTRPTAWYLALFTSNPADDASGTEVSTSGTAYARQSASFTVSGDTASNSAAIEFPTATASFGTVSHVAVFDASTGGNMIAYAALTASKAIDTGDVFRVPSGDLDITLA